MKAQQKLFATYVAKSTQQLEQELQTSVARGLTEKEAASRKKKYGSNVIVEPAPTWWSILLRQFSSFFIWLFAAMIVGSLLLQQFDAAILIALYVLINICVGFYQEYSATSNLALLKQYLITKARVLRDGKEVVINRADVVPGDIVIVHLGDRIVADMRFVTGQHLVIDEAALTGEAVPVSKKIEALAKESDDIFEAHNIGFAGTIVTGGYAIGIVFATGALTVSGNIEQLTMTTMRESGLAAGTEHMAIFLAKLIGITVVCVIAAHIAIKGFDINFLELLSFSLALAICVIPEALPVVITFCLSRSVKRLIEDKVIVKRLSAIEDLGAVEVLCADKTGTLTENKMTLTAAQGDNELVMLYAALASDEVSTKITKGFDQAIYAKLTDEQKKQIQKYTRLSVWPFDPAVRRNAVLVELDALRVLIIRGAPEDVFAATAHHAQMAHAQQWYNEHNENGERILAIAIKPMHTNDVTNQDFTQGLTFIGMLAFRDPIKASAYPAVAHAHTLGLKLKIISGDTPVVCGSVAQEIKLITDKTDVLTGAQFDALSRDAKLDAVQKYSVFARITPEQKYEIIQLLQTKYVTGYMGDGINDAPALKLANVSLAVQDATDIARDAADIVMLKKDLLAVVRGIEEGRAIVINTLKYVKTTLSAGFGNFYAIAVASLLIEYLPMLPVQILFVNLITDLPMISVATDTVDPHEQRTPKQFDIRGFIAIAMLLGIISLLFDLILFSYFKRFSESILRTVWFMVSIITELVFMFSIRTKRFFLHATRPSYQLVGSCAFAALITMILPYISWGQHWLELVPLSAKHVGVVMVIVVAYFIATESVKCLYYKNDKKK